MSGSDLGSRWGLKGDEDLGNGVHAVFQVENGFSSATGALQQGGLLFGRQAYVGLTSGYGNVTMGRQYNPENRIFWTIDAFTLGMAGGLSQPIAANQARAQLGRANNSVEYVSPDYAGLRVRLMYGFSDTGVAGNLKGGSISYDRYNLKLGAGYVIGENAYGTGNYASFTAGGNYKIYSFTVFSGFHRDWNSWANSETKFLGTQIYDMVPIGVTWNATPALTLIAQYAHIFDRTRSSAASQSSSLYAIGLTYSLSKSTFLYSDYGQIENRNGSQWSLGGGLYSGAPVGPGNPTARTFQVGISHLF
ncbi:Outer membrane protein (porin) [Paraburkholderia susongensis]|uniref:Outer membrane protein (Porin) n=2 Tax=Paraburkholderia susongensis TaxID=1515439 RepID=A0A1X7K1P3_9BURK|nr:Outer membrane protein (porin) [Paraburkholderia susongensis]